MASSVDFTIQSEHRTEIIGASKGTVILKDQGTAYALFERPTSTNDFDIQNPISDGDITFVGNDGGSTITALTLDMSEAGNANFNSNVLLETAGKYFQVAGSSSTFWAIGSSGGSNSPGTASTSLAFHHWDGSAWNNEIEFDSSGNITLDGSIMFSNNSKLRTR